MDRLPTSAPCRPRVIRSQPLAWEDLEVGRTIALRDMILSRREIVAFAASYDPQPFHLDEEAAKRTLLGGLAASGWHSCAALWARAQQDFLGRSRHRGCPSVSDVRWLAPVRPDQRLRLRAFVADRMRCARSRRVGLTSIRYEAISDTESLVMNLKAHHLFERRAPHATTQAAQADESVTRVPFAGARRRVDGIRYFEDVALGDQIELGSYAFTHQSAGEFASLAGLGNPEATLRACSINAWHVTAAWMQRIVMYYKVQAARLRQISRPVPLLGPASGIKHLRWHRPVLAGETISFRSWAERKIDLPKHIGWGLLICGAEGIDARGRRVLSFNPQLLLERMSK